MSNMETARFRARLFRPSRPKRALRLGLVILPLGASTLSLLFKLIHWSDGEMIGAFALTPVFAIPIVGWLNRTSPAGSWSEHDVTVRHHALSIDGLGPVTREDVVMGAFSPKARRLRLELKDGRILELEAPTEYFADQALDLLDLDASHRRATFENTRPVLGLLLGWLCCYFGVALGWASGWAAAVLSVVAFYAAYFVARLFRVSRVTVGSDAVLIERAFSAQLVRLGQVAGSSAEAENLHIDLVDRRGITIRLSDLAQAAASRIDQARALRPAESVATRLGELAPIGAPIATVRANLADLMGEVSQYRSAPLNLEDVAALFADPTTSLRERIIAGLTLGKYAPLPMRHEAWEAVEQLAEPRLRVFAQRSLHDVVTDDEWAAIEAASAEAGDRRTR
ncbi:MAG: hypothetical protein U0271_04710 [Polyangiaceae bacterium]